MFDILVYLFENYLHPAACPAAEQLARKLSDEGFEDDEISVALEWLSELRNTSVATLRFMPQADSARLYAPEEQAQLDVHCRSFLYFLENAGVIDATMREFIIERALALRNCAIDLHRLKIIVLIVLWQQERTPNLLILDELLADENNDANAQTLYPH